MDQNQKTPEPIGIAKHFPELVKRGIPVKRYSGNGWSGHFIPAKGLEKLFSSVNMVYTRDGEDIHVGIMAGKALLFGPYKISGTRKQDVLAKETSDVSDQNI